MEKKEKVSVVIVTYNASKWVQSCLDSVKKSSYPVEAVVVDNASSDDTISQIKTSYPEVTLIESINNLGFGRGNNLGIAHALKNGSDYVFLLNQDAKLSEDTIAQMLEAFCKYQQYGLLSPVHLEFDGKRVDPYFLRNFVNGTSRPLLEDTMLGNVLPATVYEVPIVPAAGWCLRREVFEQVGGFCPIFFMYGEDDEFVSRLKFKGWKVGVVMGAYMFHYHGLSSRTFDLQKRILDFSNMFLIQLFNYRHSYGIIALKSLTFWVKQSLKFLVRLRMKEAFALVSGFLKSMHKFRKIRYYRKVFLSEKWPYLNLR